MNLFSIAAIPPVGSFIVGLLCAMFISRYGMRVGLGDVPNARSSHRRPVPRGGGLGIPVAGALVAFAWNGQFYPFMIAALAVSFVAFLTDFHELPVRLRFSLQFVLAAMVVWLHKGDFLSMMARQYGIPVVTALVLVLVLYIVAGTNFFNFMDGINGIAGLQGIVSFAFLGIYSILAWGAFDVALLAFSVSAASLGFLFMNFPSARVFMGDVGSIFLGFLFCALVTALMGNSSEFLVLALFNGVFFVDCISTVLLRLYRRENVLQAHRKHLYQELVHKAGWTHRKVALHFAAIQLAVGAGALSMQRLPLLAVVSAWFALFLLYWGVRWRFGFFAQV